MSDLRELYQELILDHGRRPRSFGELPDRNREAEGVNPLCGDHLVLHLRVEPGPDGSEPGAAPGSAVVRDVAFKGSGCAISTASASLLTGAIKGKTVAEVEALFARVHAMLTAPTDVAPETEGLGKLAVFSGVREFPARVKCASLPWHTLKRALEGGGKASTE